MATVCVPSSVQAGSPAEDPIGWWSRSELQSWRNLYRVAQKTPAGPSLPTVRLSTVSARLISVFRVAIGPIAAGAAVVGVTVGSADYLALKYWIPSVERDLKRLPMDDGDVPPTDNARPGYDPDISYARFRQITRNQELAIGQPTDKNHEFTRLSEGADRSELPDGGGDETRVSGEDPQLSVQADVAL